MKSSLFPKARHCLLLESGALVNAAGEPETRSPNGRVLISRALCQYRLFQPPAHLKPAHAAVAARAWAKAHSPFADPEILLLRTPSAGIGVWFWDRARTEGRASERCAPESLYRADGEGWRIVTCAEGFEAQRWGGGVLLASTWRRTPFTREQWLAFVLGTEAAEGEAPELPPTPESLPLLADTHWRRARIGPPLSWRDAEKIGGSVAVVGLCLSAFFVAQALKATNDAATDTRATASITARIAQDHDAQRTREFESLIGDYNGITQQSDVLAAVADAFQVYTHFGLQVTSWRASHAEIHASIAGSLPQIPLRDVVRELEAKPTLCGVTPIFPRGREGIEISARVVAATGACPSEPSRGANS